MSDHVFIVSEWLPKEGKDQELWEHFRRLMALSRKKRGLCQGSCDSTNFAS